MSANGLEPAWQNLVDSITVRDTYYAPRSGVWKPNNKVRSIPDANKTTQFTDFNEWNNYKYCSRGNRNPLVGTSLDPQPARYITRPDNTRRQKIFRIENWQQEVSKVGDTGTDVNTEGDKAQKSFLSKKEGELISNLSIRSKPN